MYCVNNVFFISDCVVAVENNYDIGIVAVFIHSCEMHFRYLNKNVDDFEDVCKSLKITERYFQ